MSSNSIICVGACLLSFGTIAAGAMVENYPKELEQDLISVCQHAAKNNRMHMHRAVQQITVGSKLTGSTYKMLAEGLRCNGMPLAAFADYYGASDTYKVLQRYNIDTRIEIRDIQISRLPPDYIQVSFESSE